MRDDYDNYLCVVCRVNPLDGTIKEMMRAFWDYEKACAYLGKHIDDPNKPIPFAIKYVDVGG